MAEKRIVFDIELSEKDLKNIYNDLSGFIYRSDTQVTITTLDFINNLENLVHSIEKGEL